MNTYLNKKLILHLNITLSHPPDFYVLNKEKKKYAWRFLYIVQAKLSKN